MTRWARAGSSQKHKKMPGEATKWGEFDHQKANKSSSEQNKVKCESTTDLSSNKIINSNERYEHLAKQKKECFSFGVEDLGKSDNLKNADCYETFSNKLSSDVKLVATPENINRKEKSFLKEKVSAKKVKNKKRNVKKNDAGTASNLDLTGKKSEASSTKVFESKKLKYMAKLRKERANKGILLLPSKIERKLYNIRKKLKEKKLPLAVIKEVLRKERRKEELKFRKTFNPSKLCFNCRQPGHVLADCSVKLGSSSQETGICFKCGSADHTSFKCPEKVQGFPFANCFICKEQGHISKDCPKNKRGIYPKGGRCNFCGNVNHLKKDCPSLNRKKDEESVITLHTLSDVESIDAEAKGKKLIKVKLTKTPKVVKF